MRYRRCDPDDAEVMTVCYDCLSKAVSHEYETIRTFTGDNVIGLCLECWTENSCHECGEQLVAPDGTCPTPEMHDSEEVAR